MLPFSLTNGLVNLHNNKRAVAVIGSSASCEFDRRNQQADYVTCLRQYALVGDDLHIPTVPTCWSITSVHDFLHANDTN